MMKNMRSAILLALGLMLSACAPATLGSQVLNPLIGGTGIERAKVQAGQTVYIQYTYPRSFFDLSDQRFVNPVLGSPTAIRTELSAHQKVRLDG
jgi:hypothetical protein